MDIDLKEFMVAMFAICALHSFLVNRKSVYASPTDFNRDIQRNWRNELGRINILQSIEYSAHMERLVNSANDVRERFKNYFISDG